MAITGDDITRLWDRIQHGQDGLHHAAQLGLDLGELRAYLKQSRPTPSPDNTMQCRQHNSICFATDNDDLKVEVVNQRGDPAGTALLDGQAINSRWQ